MAKPKVSPLHKVIDTGRWDAEPPLGRLVLLVHAAFLDAGFVPHGSKPRKSVRYMPPQLLHRRDAEPAVLRLRRDGHHVVFYICFSYVDVQPDTYSMSLDALAAASLLSGDLDSTGRALRNEEAVAALWNALADGLCRRLLVDMCRRYGVLLEPAFMSLPGDVKVAILGRLSVGEDLARVECTCTELRHLVADHDEELWKPRFLALQQDAPYLTNAGSSEVSSWKARYTRGKRTRSVSFFLSLWSRPFEAVDHVRITLMEHNLTMARFHFLPPSHNIQAVNDIPWLEPSHGQMAHAVPGRISRREKTRRSKCMHGHGRSWTAASDLLWKKQHGAGAIHSPSSKFRWKHR